MFGGTERRRPRAGGTAMGQPAGRGAQRGRLHTGQGLRGRLGLHGRQGLRGLAARAIRWGMAGALLVAAGCAWIGVPDFAGAPAGTRGGPAASGCTALAIDRDNGPTTAQPCPHQATRREATVVAAGRRPAP